MSDFSCLLQLSAAGFADLGVPAALVAVLADLGITTPTPIQAATLPDSLAGRDVLGRGRTGSGKTYAFLLPLVAAPRRVEPAGRRPRKPRALILAPTRELVEPDPRRPRAAGQGRRPHAPSPSSAASARTRRSRASRKGVDIVLACPGRLEDLMQPGPRAT